jgi:hypothetical protein
MEVVLLFVVVTGRDWDVFVGFHLVGHRRKRAARMM